MNILLLLSHAIAEYDEVRMFHHLGFDVFCPGAYTDPGYPGVEFGTEPFRPALPDVPFHADLAALCAEQRAKHAGQPTDFGIVDWAKADLHPDLIEWADAIIVHHFPEAWIGGQWDAIKHKRVIWRTCGQSNPLLEVEMRRYAEQGLQIVRYSPKERAAFEPLGCFAGQDALIRFGKFPADYGPWIGDVVAVGNVTQNLTERGEHCGLSFWEQATKGLPTMPAGLGSERLPNGTGALSYRGMLDYLAHLRCYLYMGTQPASYTLALIEAMLTGVPIMSIGPGDMWMPALFEGHEIVGDWFDDPVLAQKELSVYLDDMACARADSEHRRDDAIELFGMDTIGPQWLAFLGAPVPKVAEAVAA